MPVQRGIGGLVRIIVDATGVSLEPWMAPAGVVAIGLLSLPLLRMNAHTDRARRLMKEAGREAGAARERLEEQALAEVTGRPVGLVVLADEAIRQGRTEIARRAIEALRATGKRFTDLRRLEGTLEGPTPRTPLEAALLVERLVAAGLVDQARARWEAARRRWPDNPDLEALAASLGAHDEDAGTTGT